MISLSCIYVCVFLSHSFSLGENYMSICIYLCIIYYIYTVLCTYISKGKAKFCLALKAEDNDVCGDHILWEYILPSWINFLESCLLQRSILSLWSWASSYQRTTAFHLCLCPLSNFLGILGLDHWVSLR